MMTAQSGVGFGTPKQQAGSRRTRQGCMPTNRSSIAAEQQVVCDMWGWQLQGSICCQQQLYHSSYASFVASCAGWRLLGQNYSRDQNLAAILVDALLCPALVAIPV